MTTTFTDEEFKGYKFLCDTTGANMGFKHVCRVVDNEGQEVLKEVINWGNKTWEPYQYASVYSQAKSSLEEKLSGEEKQELDTEFLETLAIREYIRDYGEDLRGNMYILVDSWSQVEEGSVWDKLVELAKKNLLKPSINHTMLELDREYVFSDEFVICPNCGRLCSLTWNEAKFIESEYEYYCYDCINEDHSIVRELVDEASESFEKALLPDISDETLEEMGYSPVNSGKSYSFDRENWSADCHISKEFAEEICAEFGGFAKIIQVQQFDVLFTIFVPTDNLEEANKELGVTEE